MNACSEISETQLQAIREQLQPGEQLCWTGSEPSHRYRLQHWLRLLVYAAWIGLAAGFAGYMIALNPAFTRGSLASSLPELVPLVLACAGIALFVWELIHPWKLAPDIYAITSRRLLVITCGRQRRTWQYGREILPRLQLRYSRDDSGTIIVEHRFRWDVNAQGRLAWHAGQVCLYGLRDVEMVYNHLQRIGQPD